MKAYASISEPPTSPGNAAASPKSTRDSFNGLQVADRVSQEEIQHRAYALWQREGEPHDRDLAHWLQAEEVMHREKRPVV